MRATLPCMLRIRPLPANVRLNEAVARQAAATAQRAAPTPPAPTVVEQLHAAPLPSNVRLVPYVPRKNRFWKVAKHERDALRAEFRET